jgi:AraC family transcriptional regulator of adaptative response / DNA-3-methyladenine glycosylase II
LIADGVVDTEGVASLANRLAVSSRHLHRELVAEVGVGPLPLARTRRAQTARLLIDQTDLSLTTIAFTAGFASLRQFNDTMQAAFGCAPSVLRRRSPSEQRGEGKLTLRLAYRPPLAVAGLLSYLAARAIPGVEEVSGGQYRRTVAFPHSCGKIELEPLERSPYVLLRLQLTDLSDLNLVVQRCRQLFDLDADPSAIATILTSDPLLAPLVAARPGLRVPGAVDGFELAVRAIVGQQVSVAGARTLVGRLVTAFGVPLEQPQGSLTHFFPGPHVLISANLQGLGLTNGRVKALQALAHAVVEDGLVLDRTADREQTVAHLQQLPGVGPWTAAYIAMRTLGDPDAFPSADLGLRRVLTPQGARVNLRNIEKQAEAWRPWRAYAAQYLWANLSKAGSLKPGDRVGRSGIESPVNADSVSMKH